MSETYDERRTKWLERFQQMTLVPDRGNTFRSPSGRYELAISYYSGGPNSFGASRGIVRALESDGIIADVKRNYGAFWHAWVTHPNGCEYLLCGEDYQGQTVVNLDLGRVTHSFPIEGHGGWGFCWTAAYPSPNGLLLAVDGCYWGAPYEVVVYDFRNPEEPPYLELARGPGIWEWKRWVDDYTVDYLASVDVRRSDEKLYDELSDEEQDLLDKNPTLMEERKIVRRIALPRNNGS